MQSPASASRSRPVSDIAMLASRNTDLPEKHPAISFPANQLFEPPTSSLPPKILDQPVPLSPLRKTKVSPQLPLLLFLLSFFLFSPRAYASTHTAEGALSFGQKVAQLLRSSGIPDEAIIFLIASLPVVELRGAVPVAYWLQMDPLKASVLAILG